MSVYDLDSRRLAAAERAEQLARDAQQSLGSRRRYRRRRLLSLAGLPPLRPAGDGQRPQPAA
jgi:hypothetical protein